MPRPIYLPTYPPAKFVKIIDQFRQFLLRFARKLTVPNVTIIEMTQGFYVSRAIGVAANLNIADHLKNENKNISELASLTNSHEESLYRLMRMLASQGIFSEKKNKVFSQNKLSATLLNGQDSMHDMVTHQINGINWKLFEELEYTVKTGNNAANKVIGCGIFKYLENHPDRNEIYNHAMTNSSLMLAYAVISSYKFNNAKCVIDIGGGHGILLSIILCKYAKLRGRVFDLPHVVYGAEENFKKYGVEDRAEMVSGSFFESIPEGGDVYLMKNVIHSLDDDQCIALLENIKMVLPDHGKILILEPIIENNNRYSFAKLYDIQMMVGRNGGKERTKVEYLNMVEKAGLRLHKVIETVSPFSLIEIVK